MAELTKAILWVTIPPEDRPYNLNVSSFQLTFVRGENESEEDFIENAKSSIIRTKKRMTE